MEPLLKANTKRLVLYPILYPDLWDMYKTAQKTYWTAEEVDLKRDLIDWNERLNHDEKFLISQILAFFAMADGLVIENLAQNFCNEIQIPEARSFYSYQIMNEAIHSEMYSLIIDTYFQDIFEKERLLMAVESIPCVAKKADWVLKWMQSKDFGCRLVVFACVEGIFFSAAFAVIFWVKDRGLLPGLCQSNELISRDEGLHRDFACLLFRDHLIHKPDCVLQIIDEAVELEKEFVRDAIPHRLQGLNADMLNTYVMYVADHLLMQMGLAPHYKVKNPFHFMESISLDGKTNFFEKRVTEYQKYNINEELKFDVDF